MKSCDISMDKTILEYSNEEARQYFLQASRYCTIDLPKYFDFQPLLKFLEQKIGRQKISDIQAAKPNDCEEVNYKFLTNKDGNFAWRPLQIINPAIYICLVNRITESTNWEIIKRRFSQFQENRRIRCYSLPLQTEECEEQLKKDKSTAITNWWEKIEQQSIEFALEYNCVLITDITDCYGSIYTHSIGWAIHGKELAREHRNDDSPTLIGCIIDKIIQAMSYRQTNGIPQGSVLMDFIAEMVLGYADYELSERIKNTDCKEIDYQIIRYRDDYRIFAKKQEEAISIAKILSEVLSELNLKLNTQKTIISNKIIRDVIKPDKLYWNGAKNGEKTLQKHLLLIYDLSEKYPNSGSLSTALDKFINRICPLKKIGDSTKVLVSILADIAYNNPRTYPAVIVCIGKILSLESDTSLVDDIYGLIEKKFKDKPNVGHWKVWFQRLTIKNDREREHDSEEKLCQIAAKKSNIMLWNTRWLKPEYQKVINEKSIFNEEVFDNMSEQPKKEEIQLFKY